MGEKTVGKGWVWLGLVCYSILHSRILATLCSIGTMNDILLVHTR